MALAGEIRTYVDFLNPPDRRALAPGASPGMWDNMRQIASIKDRATRVISLGALGKLPNTHPVFDKVADKLGYLGTDDATAASRFYNVITGMRLQWANLSSPGFLAASDDHHAATLRVFANMLENEVRAGRALSDRLTALARLSWFDSFIGL